MSLELPQFISLVSKAFEKNDEEQAFQMWLSLYPNMTQENFMSFDDYYKTIKKPKDRRKAKDIVKDVEEMYSKYEWSETPS